MKAIKHLLAIMLPVRKLMLLAAGLSFLTVASNTLLLAVSAYLIAAAALHPPLAALSTAITGVRLFGLSRAVLRYGERYISHKAAFQILSKMRFWFYTKVEPLAMDRFLSVKSGDLLSGIVSDIDTLQFFYLRVIAPPFVAFFTLLFICWWLSYFGGSLVLVLTLSFFLAGLAVPFLFRQQAHNLAAQKLSSRDFFKNLCVDALGGFKEMASSGNFSWQLEKLNQAALAYERTNHRVNALAAKCESLKSWVLNLALITLLFLAGQLASAGTFDKVWLAVVVIAAEGCFEAVGPLALLRVSLDEAILSWKNLSGITAGNPPAREKTALVPVNFNLKVSNLSFSYEDHGREVLSNISFELKEGGHLAIVGASGAGKSTLVNILCGFFDYKKGNINFGGHELSQYAGDDLRTYLAVVSQKNYLFNASVRDNILLAKPTATREEFCAAIDYAGLEHFFSDNASPDKPGALLSGGERQRVALARAFLKNPPLLILDEPTASLDPANAKKIMSSICKLMQNRSSILITHDLSLLGNAGEIILLEQGAVRERGTLPNLIAQNGLFAKMYGLQNSFLKLTTLYFGLSLVTNGSAAIIC